MLVQPLLSSMDLTMMIQAFECSWLGHHNAFSVRLVAVVEMIEKWAAGSNTIQFHLVRGNFWKSLLTVFAFSYSFTIIN